MNYAFKAFSPFLVILYSPRSVRFNNLLSAILRAVRMIVLLNNTLSISVLGMRNLTRNVELLMVSSLLAALRIRSDHVLLFAITYLLIDYTLIYKMNPYLATFILKSFSLIISKLRMRLFCILSGFIVRLV